MSEAYVVAFGNPISGFEYVGPFWAKKSAEAYCAKYLDPFADYWIVLLQEPVDL